MVWLCGLGQVIGSLDSLFVGIESKYAFLDVFGVLLCVWLEMDLD